MRPSHSRFAATIIVGLFVAAACSSAATPIPVVTPTPPRELRDIDADRDRGPDSRHHADPNTRGPADRQPDEVRRRHASRGRPDCDPRRCAGGSL